MFVLLNKFLESFEALISVEKGEYLPRQVAEVADCFWHIHSSDSWTGAVRRCAGLDGLLTAVLGSLHRKFPLVCEVGELGGALVLNKDLDDFNKSSLTRGIKGHSLHILSAER